MNTKKHLILLRKTPPTSVITKLFIAILFQLFFLSGFSTVYYVSSSSGNDSNPGTSENTSWKSLEKVNSFTFKAGDQILFKRGDEWSGTIIAKSSGASGNPVVYGAWGTGEKPKIYGSEIITGWTKHSGNIFKTKVTDEVTQLFINEKRAKIARYPKSEFLKITRVNNATEFVSESLQSKADNYYKGATLAVKSFIYQLNFKTVTSSSGQTLKIDSQPEGSLGIDKGFFLINKLDFLTEPGEWYFDSDSKTLYAWMPGSDSPENYEIKGSVYDRGVSVANGIHYISVRDISFIHQSSAGVYSYNSNNITVEDSDFSLCQGYGIHAGYVGNRLNFKNNRIFDVFTGGIHINYGDNNIIEDNLIEKAGRLESLGNFHALYDSPGIGIASLHGNSTIQYNRIKNAGYIAIYFNTGTCNIYRNYIDGALMELNDGAAIYSYSGDYNSKQIDDSVIEENLIFNSFGNSDGTNQPYHLAFGIYFDNKIKNVIVKNNLIANSSGGINLNGGGKNVISNNIFFDCMVDINSSSQVEPNNIENNIMYKVNRFADFPMLSNTHQRFVFQLNNANNIFENNCYVVPCTKSNVFVGYSDFNEWQADGNDKNGSFYGESLAKDEKEELFYNDTKQPKTFSFGTTVYRDIYGKEVTGKLTLEPFTSTILIKTTKTDKANQSPVINDQTFNIEAPVERNFLIGKAEASDPDANQILTYSIIQGNEQGLFAINPSTGEIRTNSRIESEENKTYTLVVKAEDNDINPLSATAEITIFITAVPKEVQLPDNTPPVINKFSIPEEYASLTIPVISFEATDNSGVTGFLLSETNKTPLLNDKNWSAQPPAEYKFTTEGTHTLYAWVKDEAGNISASISQNIHIELPDYSYRFSEYLFEEPNGNIVFDSNSSNNGTISGTFKRKEGAAGNGIEFNGSGYVNLGDSFSDNIKDEVTLSAWLKPDLNSNGYQGIIMHGGPNTDTYALYIYPETKTIGFKTSGTSSEWFTADNTEELWDGNWHHIAAVYDGKEKRIFIDNKLIASINATGDIETGTGYNLLLGAGRDETIPELLYSGMMDEVRIYNYSLDIDEIGELFHPVNKELHKISVSENVVICEGENYMGWTSSGVYKQTLKRKLQSASGADSIVTVYLSVNSAYEIFTEASICEGETYILGTQRIKEEGKYTETFKSITGCDSTVILNLSVNPKYHQTEDVTIFEGENYSGWSEPGIYERNLVSSTGCDSIVTTRLTVLQNEYTEEHIAVCEGDSHYGQTSSGRYERILKSVSGADSVIVTYLEIIPVVTDISEAVICEGDTYLFGTKELTNAGRYSEVFKTVNGCDSIVELNLSVNPKYKLTESISINKGENYLGWTQSGVYEQKLVSSTGCDSIVVTNLTVTTQLEEHTIQLKAGWNIISSFIKPSDKKMESVLAQLINNETLVKVQDENNKTFEYKNKRTGWINNIGDFEETKGYKIQVKRNTNLTIRGNKTDLPLNIPLSKGWNIISFPLDESVDAMKILKPLISDGILEKAQDEAGMSIEKWRSSDWKNGIGNFKPGKGYLVKVRNQGILRITESLTKSAQNIEEDSEPHFFCADYEGNGIGHMNINLMNLSDSDLKEGDEIAVFNDGFCYGAVKLTGDDILLNAVSLPATSSEGGLYNGFAENDSIILKFWSSDKTEELPVMLNVLDGELIYNRRASVFVSLSDITVNTNEISNKLPLIKIYPNPAEDIINIKFTSQVKTGGVISVLDISGRLLKTQTINSETEIIQIMNLQPGTYFLKIPTSSGFIVQKFIKK